MPTRPCTRQFWFNKILNLSQVILILTFAYMKGFGKHVHEHWMFLFLGKSLIQKSKNKWNVWISNKTNFNDTSPYGLALHISWSQSSFNCHREGKIVSQPSPNTWPLGTIAQNGFECIQLKWQSWCRVGLSIGGQTNMV